ncbi:glycosyltransferase family 4 protein [Sphingomonas alpina]|uniref:Glycosyltransferase family 1 protein n=1 Tax=Sphingomonas alpina TaxID=653931 RepID=A0A7H0LHF3_9SPHN|nr:glycosyltransferase family 1 protein [Sphingomonas alpina]QNQ09106.1 glycosyltransferase family 1 protein [Sphingomonas alpina]
MRASATARGGIDLSAYARHRPASSKLFDHGAALPRGAEIAGPGPGVRADGLRVALFSGNYNCVRDGANKALNRLVAHLLDRGAAVRIYSPAAPVPAFAPAGDLVPVPSIAIPGRPEYRLATGLPARIRDDIRRFAPNIVHLSAPDLLNMKARRFARSMGVPVVASLHTRFDTYFAYYGLGLLRRPATALLSHFYRGCDMVLAPNRFEAAGLEEMGVEPGAIRLWGRGVDTETFTPALRDPAWRRAQGFADEDMVLLFFGRLVLEKGLDVFADTVGELRRRGHRARALVVGMGPAEQHFRDRLGDAVFAGHLEGQQLGRAVASADILINPSVTEAFGNVNLEAMAAGLAIVSANVGSARALIDDRMTGRLVAPNPADLADAAMELMLRRGERAALGRAAHRAACGYRWSDILDGAIASYHVASLPAGPAPG